MSDEPLYCTHCGAEDWGCGCPMPATAAACGPYCECCGVIPAPGKHCSFYRPDGNETGCESC